MKPKFWMVCAGAALALAAAGCAGSMEPQQEFPGGQQEMPAGGAGGEVNPQVSLEQAQQAAQDRVQGELIETNLVRESSGDLRYAVTIHTPNEPDVLNHTVFVDANDGSVLRVEDRALLIPSGAEISQEEAQRTVLARLDGRITEATLMNLDGRAVWQFEVAARNGVNKVMYVDAQTGEFVKSMDLLKSHPGAGMNGGQQPQQPRQQQDQQPQDQQPPSGQ